jgi:hypothetical protein
VGSYHVLAALVRPEKVGHRGSFSGEGQDYLPARQCDAEHVAFRSCPSTLIECVPTAIDCSASSHTSHRQPRDAVIPKSDRRHVMFETFRGFVKGAHFQLQPSASTEIFFI